MSDFDRMLGSVLGDAAQMEKISSMAKSLMGEGGAEKAEEEAPLDMGMLKKLGGLMKAPDGRERKLLDAMRPYLSDKRRSKMDRAMKLARLAEIAEKAASEFGGEDDV